MPTQRTPVDNLILTGAHTSTTADVWSVEAAVEAGRLAAREVDVEVTALAQHKNLFLSIFSAVDDVCYRLRLPHWMDCVLVGSVAIAVIFTAYRLFG